MEHRVGNETPVVFSGLSDIKTEVGNGCFFSAKVTRRSPLNFSLHGHESVRREVALPWCCRHCIRQLAVIPFDPPSLPAVCGGGVLTFRAVEVLVWTGVDFFCGLWCELRGAGVGYVRNTKIWPDTASPKFFFFAVWTPSFTVSWRKELGRDVWVCLSDSVALLPPG